MEKPILNSACIAKDRIPLKLVFSHSLHVRFWPIPAFQLENFKIPVRREVDGNSRPKGDIVLAGRAVPRRRYNRIADSIIWIPFTSSSSS